MALCPHCNQQVGWFEKAHEKCVQLYKQKALQTEQARLQRDDFATLIWPHFDRYIWSHPNR